MQTDVCKIDDVSICKSGALSQQKECHFCYRRIVYGNNDIVVPLQNIGVLLLLEFLNPFYIFQVFTLAVWFAEGYLYYTIAIILMSLFGITSSIIQTRKVCSVQENKKKKKIMNKLDKSCAIKF